MMDTIPFHRSIHWLTSPFLLAVDVRWICAELDLVYKHLLTYISYLVYKPYPFSVGSFFEGFMAPAKS
jgi:hypothetical protein